MSRRYEDLRQHLETLRREGLLLTIDKPVDKDSELHPLVRWQYVGGVEEHERKAFLFTNVVDALGPQIQVPGGRRRLRRQPAHLLPRHEGDSGGGAAAMGGGAGAARSRRASSRKRRASRS